MLPRLDLHGGRGLPEKDRGLPAKLGSGDFPPGFEMDLNGESPFPSKVGAWEGASNCHCTSLSWRFDSALLTEPQPLSLDEEEPRQV